METFITRLFRLPPAVSEHGPAMDRLMFYVHVLMAVLFVGWSIYFFYTLWRFNERRVRRADPVGVRSHTSSYAEVGVAVVEGILLFGLALPMWSRTASAGNYPDPREATEVRVIGRQFNWLARYPGDDGLFGRADARLVTGANPLGIDPEDPLGQDDFVIEGGEMVVPVGRPVILHLTSLDVVHSFSVKAMRVTQDAIPGLSNPVWFTPTVEGTYQIICAQLCGNGHASMRGLLRVASEEDYAVWKHGRMPAAAATVGYE